MSDEQLSDVYSDDSGVESSGSKKWIWIVVAVVVIIVLIGGYFVFFAGSESDIEESDNNIVDDNVNGDKLDNVVVEGDDDNDFIKDAIYDRYVYICTDFSTYDIPKENCNTFGSCMSGKLINLIKELNSNEEIALIEQEIKGSSGKFNDEILSNNVLAGWPDDRKPEYYMELFACEDVAK